MIFLKIMQEMLKIDLILQLMNQTHRYQKEKKVIRLMKDELGGTIMANFAELRAKTYTYLIDDGSEDKKPKGTKKCVIK